MVIFHSYVTNYQRVKQPYPQIIHGLSQNKDKNNRVLCWHLPALWALQTRSMHMTVQRQQQHRTWATAPWSPSLGGPWRSSGWDPMCVRVWGCIHGLIDESKRWLIYSCCCSYVQMLYISVCACVCVCVFTTYAYTHVYIYKHTCVHPRTNDYTLKWMYIYIYTYVYVYKYLYIMFIYIYTQYHISLYIYI